MTISVKCLIFVIFLVHETTSHGHHRWGGRGPPWRRPFGKRSHDSSYESQESTESHGGSSSLSESKEEKDRTCDPWIAKTLDSLRTQVLYLQRNIKENCKEDVLSTLCKDNYDYAGGRCYRLSREDLDWHKARFNCTMDGGDLVALESPLEEEALTDYIVHKEGFRFQRFHTAGNDQEYKGLWHWGLGQEAVAVTYENWGKKEPNDYRGKSENCIEYRPLGGWNDVICDCKRRFICELPPTYNPKAMKAKPVNRTVEYRKVIPYNVPAPPYDSSEESSSSSSDSYSSPSGSDSSSSGSDSGESRSTRDGGRQFKLKPKYDFYHKHGDINHGHLNYGPHHHSSHSKESSEESDEDQRRSKEYSGQYGRPSFHGAKLQSHSKEESRSDESSDESSGSHESRHGRYHPRHHSRGHWHHHPYNRHHHHHGPPHHRHHYHSSPYEYFKHKYYSLFKRSGHYPWWKKHWYHHYRDAGSSSRERHDSRERHTEYNGGKRPGTKSNVFLLPVHIVKVPKNGTNSSEANTTGQHSGANGHVPYHTHIDPMSMNKTGNNSANSPQSEDPGIYVYSYVPPHRPQRIYYPALSPTRTRAHRKPYGHKPHRIPSIYHLLYTSYNGEGRKDEGMTGRTTSKGDPPGAGDGMTSSSTVPTTMMSGSTTTGTGAADGGSSFLMNLTSTTTTTTTMAPTMDTSSPTASSTISSSQDDSSEST